MGGSVHHGLSSHRRDDRFYHKKRRELKKYLPLLVQHLDKMRKNNEKNSTNYAVLHELFQQISNSSVRVPMHILLRGEDMLRREVLNNHEAKNSIIEAVWRSAGFRAAVTKKLSETIKCNSVVKVSEEMQQQQQPQQQQEEQQLHTEEEEDQAVPESVVVDQHDPQPQQQLQQQPQLQQPQQQQPQQQSIIDGERVRSRSPEEMEAHIFERARTKEEYLMNAARIIIYLREQKYSRAHADKRAELQLALRKRRAEEEEPEGVADSEGVVKKRLKLEESASVGRCVEIRA